MPWAKLPVYRNEQAPQQERMNDLLSLLTVEEKVCLLIAGSPGIARLGSVYRRQINRWMGGAWLADFLS